MMRKYLVLVLLCTFIFVIIILNNNITYSYMECENYIIEPYEVSTLNLESYLSSIKYNYIKSFCSYDMCYQIKEKNISKSIDNFSKIYDKQLSEDNKLIVSVKGYPISKIIVNNC